MRIPSKSPAGPNGGYALILVMVFMALGLFMLASSMQWTTNSTRITERNNRYTRVLAAAEAATEMVMAYIERDYQYQGVNANLDVYRALSPASAAGNGWASDFIFSDAQGNVNKTYFITTGTLTFTVLNSEYQGLMGLVTPYKVISNARLVDPSMDVSAGVKQEFQLASIPVFQFAIFYSLDLEINPGADMIVNGKVHSNANLYTSPGASLKFLDDVTAVGNLIYNRSPNDPQASSGVIPTFMARHDGGVASLALPVGTNNSPVSVRQVLDVPPSGEDPNSAMGHERYYNKADLIVQVQNSSVTLKSGNWDNFNAIAQNTPGTNSGYSFIKTNAWFYNGRELKKIRTVDIDVGALRTWITNTATTGGDTVNDLAVYRLGHGVAAIYVDDQRTAASSEQTAVRVLNGLTLPDAGLTVATPRPIYVQGHFNAPDITVGSTNTINTKPASLIGDSINVLSQAWLDSQNQGTSPGFKNATNTTVNAALLGGIKESATISGTKQYSGGVENFPRFLENWTGDNMTYNGSMVVMFPSRYATNNWVGTGTYYNPPTRKWAFDLNFLQQNRLPPGTPQVRKLVRGTWSAVQPGQVN